MKISEYPYGKPSKSLKNTVSWLNRNKKRLAREFILEEFDFPDYWSYWGLPRRITCRLGSDEVDWLQSEISNWENYCKIEYLIGGNVV